MFHRAVATLLLVVGAAPAQVKPYIIFDIDTSESMLWNSCGDSTTEIDDTAECPGTDVSCSTCSIQGCGDGIANDSRLWKVKRATTDVLSAFGEVTFGLARFHQTPASFTCKSGGWRGATACIIQELGVGDNSGDILVDFADGNQREILEWLDYEDNYEDGTPPPDECSLCPATGDCGGGCDKELRGTGATPIAGSLYSVRQHLGATRAADPLSFCRPYAVILLTDGADTCFGEPAAQAALTCDIGIPVHSIGFGTCPSGCLDPCFADCPGGTCPSACFDDSVQAHPCIEDCLPGCQLFCQTNAIAQAGCSAACNRAPGGQQVCHAQPIMVDNEADLALAMSSIVQSTLLVEICNYVDDDCDGLTDEGFPVGEPCGLGICAGFLDCSSDGTGTDCIGGATATEEECNGLDDDCDGLIDEGFPHFCGCVPQAEVCNGEDDDCDGLTDEEFVPTPCGSDVGECTPGLTECSGGVISCVGEIGPSPEVCNALDDNCDTVTDQMITTCYDFSSGCDLFTATCEGVCRIGLAFCSAGVFDECDGDRGPEPEVCDNIDNDCDGITDDDDMGGNVCCGVNIERCNGVDDDCDNLTDESFPEDGLPCGAHTGECEPGTTVCRDGELHCINEVGPTPEVCDGEDDDCDGSVDEDVAGLGAPCGDDTGSCEPGIQACVNGVYVCSGAVGPVPEACDCQDNDCDTQVDEDVDCPGNGVCRTEFCQCVLPCGDGEFPCPGGYVAQGEGDDCYCEPDVCVGVECDEGEACRVIDGRGRCVPLCEGVACDDHERCENGQCVDDSCETLGCPDGQECIDYECVDNPCAEVECESGKFCTDGRCCPSRCVPACGPGEWCHVADCQARCEPDPCDGVACPRFHICQEGDCVPDPCAAVTCKPGQTCCDGTCGPDPCLTSTCAEDHVCDSEAACRGREPCVPIGVPAAETLHLTASGAGGCACAFSPQPPPVGAAALLVLALAVAARPVRKPQRRGRAPSPASN